MAEFHTIGRSFLETADKFPNKAAYHRRTSNGWQKKTWSELKKDIEDLCIGLVKLGLEHGEVGAIWGKNSPEWVQCELAMASIGCLTASIYPTASKDDVALILGNSEAKVLFIDDEESWAKIQELRSQFPKLTSVVLLKPGLTPTSPDILAWNLIANTPEPKDAYRNQVHTRLHSIKSSDPFLLIYTSGTTKSPKGVLYTHDMLNKRLHNWVKTTAMSSEDRVLSYLPLAHVATQAFDCVSPWVTGYEVFFLDDINLLPWALQTMQPTLFFGVPRVWEKIHEKISLRLDQAKGLKKLIANWALGVAKKVAVKKRDGEYVSLILTLQHQVAEKIFFHKVRKGLGLDHAKRLLCAGAPLAAELRNFFADFGIFLDNAYGLTEVSGATHHNKSETYRAGSVGKIYDALDECKIGEEGEILFRGPMTFTAYYRNEEASQDAFTEDGWFKTGDLGEIDSDGYLFIVGRKKDIIVTSGGKKIVPVPIEEALKAGNKIIDRAVVVGNDRRFITALITLTDGHNPQDPQIKADIQKTIDQLNETLGQVEKIKNFTILGRSFSVEAGEITPTFKVKRQTIEKKFREEIDLMYKVERIPKQA